VPDVVPFIGYEDLGAAADWLVHAFGFVEVERMEGHVTVRNGDALLFLGNFDGYRNPRFPDVPWIVDGVYIEVDDLDVACERARASGARILTEPADDGHGRIARIEDPSGHRWMVATRPRPRARRA
jgi:uncharacterized glyoxalase superfamily protein PhnB